MGKCWETLECYIRHILEGSINVPFIYKKSDKSLKAPEVIKKPQIHTVLMR